MIAKGSKASDYFELNENFDPLVADAKHQFHSLLAGATIELEYVPVVYDDRSYSLGFNHTSYCGGKKATAGQVCDIISPREDDSLALSVRYSVDANDTSGIGYQVHDTNATYGASFSTRFKAEAINKTELYDQGIDYSRFHYLEFLNLKLLGLSDNNPLKTLNYYDSSLFQLIDVTDSSQKDGYIVGGPETVIEVGIFHQKTLAWICIDDNTAEIVQRTNFELHCKYRVHIVQPNNNSPQSLRFAADYKAWRSAQLRKHAANAGKAARNIPPSQSTEGVPEFDPENSDYHLKVRLSYNPTNYEDTFFRLDHPTAYPIVRQAMFSTDGNKIYFAPNNYAGVDMSGSQSVCRLGNYGPFPLTEEKNGLGGTFRKCDLLTATQSGLLAGGASVTVTNKTSGEVLLTELDRTSITRSGFYASRPFHLFGGNHEVMELAVVQNGNNHTTSSGMPVIPNGGRLAFEDDDLQNYEDAVMYKYDPEGMFKMSMPSESWGSVAIADIYPSFGRLEGGTPINLLARLPLLENRYSPISDLHCNFGNLYHSPVEVIVPQLANATRLAIMNKHNSADLFINLQSNYHNPGDTDVMAKPETFPRRDMSVFDPVIGGNMEEWVLLSSPRKKGAYYLYHNRTYLYLNVIKKANITYQIDRARHENWTDPYSGIDSETWDPAFDGTDLRRTRDESASSTFGTQTNYQPTVSQMPETFYDTSAAGGYHPTKRRRLTEVEENIGMRSAQRRRLGSHGDVGGENKTFVSYDGVKRYLKDDDDDNEYMFVMQDWDGVYSHMPNEYMDTTGHKRTDALFEFQVIGASNLFSEGATLGLFHLATQTYMKVQDLSRVNRDATYPLYNSTELTAKEQEQFGTYDIAYPTQIVPVRAAKAKYGKKNRFQMDSAYRFTVRLFDTTYPTWSYVKCTAPPHNTPEVLPITFSTGKTEAKDQGALKRMADDILQTREDIVNVGAAVFEYVPNFRVKDYQPKRLMDVVHLDRESMPERFVVFQIENLEQYGGKSLANSYTRLPVHCNVNNVIVEGAWETRSSVRCPIRRTLPALKRERYFSEPVRQVMTPTNQENMRLPELKWNFTALSLFRDPKVYHDYFNQVNRLEEGELEKLQDYMDEFFVHMSEQANHEYYVGFSLNGPEGDFIYPEGEKKEADPEDYLRGVDGDLYQTYEEYVNATSKSATGA
jgi:hypothetical protein